MRVCKSERGLVLLTHTPVCISQTFPLDSLFGFPQILRRTSLVTVTLVLALFGHCPRLGTLFRKLRILVFVDVYAGA